MSTINDTTNYSDVSSYKYHNKKIRIKCVVSGKSVSPYCIPKKIEVRCYPKKGNACEGCTFKRSFVLDINPYDETILKFVDVPMDRFTKIIKDAIQMQCDIDYTVLEMQNIERIFVLPPVSKDRAKSGLAQISYYVGYGLDINTMYEMEGYTTVDPNNQTATHVFTSAERVSSDIESFTLTNEMHEMLTTEFAVKEHSARYVFEYLQKLYEFYSHNITKIYNRFDLHLAIDLAFKSVLSFNFDNEFVHKGWIDAFVIGDTRCGKGYVAEKLMRYFDLGEVVSGDNCSFAGLVGGLQQINKHWVVTWGKIPLNDCGLVVIDEAGEIQSTDWTKLSRIRSEGVAEITKIQVQITNARTRLIWLANPINKTISNYSYGIQSINDIIKAPEDVARFDYVLVVAHNEVSVNDINKHQYSVDSMHSQINEQNLMMWIWSKKPDEVKFSKEAVDLIYRKSIELSKQYTFTIPLIQGENIRIKLAKIAICFAGRVYSNRENGKYLFVEDYHVECAVAFLNLIYKKDSSGYYAMSQLQKDITVDYNDKDFGKISKYFDTWGDNRLELCKCLLSNNNITLFDLSEHMNQPQEMAREIISKLSKEGCVVKKGLYYIKTPAFINWLKRLVLQNEKKT